MKCPQCSSYVTDVKETRRGQGYMRRRYLCRGCRYRFTTHETVVAEQVCHACGRVLPSRTPSLPIRWCSGKECQKARKQWERGQLTKAMQEQTQEQERQQAA